MTSKKHSEFPSEPDGATVLKDVLKRAEPRPEKASSPSDKIQYAVKFADAMAEHLAADLQPRFKGIQATTSRTAGAVTGKKQLDVNFSTPALGLALGISLKSVHTRDVKSPYRYTHNRKRNEEELRIEASGYHKRQPYAVMIGVLFLPFDSCDDAKKDASSFGSWVRHLRPYTGRTEPEDAIDRFEALYIALYEPNGTDLRFFDVENAPPKIGRPAEVMSYAEFLDDVQDEYLLRNHAEFTWADGDEEPLDVDEIEGDDDEET
jgi:hypothetical protein